MPRSRALIEIRSVRGVAASTVAPPIGASLTRATEEIAAVFPRAGSAGFAVDAPVEPVTEAVAATAGEADWPGCWGVIAVGFRAKGARAGIVAQQQAHTEIIDALVRGEIDRDAAVLRAQKVRRVFDIVPSLCLG